MNQNTNNNNKSVRDNKISPVFSPRCNASGMRSASGRSYAEPPVASKVLSAGRRDFLGLGKRSGTADSSTVWPRSAGRTRSSRLAPPCRWPRPPGSPWSPLSPPRRCRGRAPGSSCGRGSGRGLFVFVCSFHIEIYRGRV